MRQSLAYSPEFEPGGRRRRKDAGRRRGSGRREGGGPQKHFLWTMVIVRLGRLQIIFKLVPPSTRLKGGQTLTPTRRIGQTRRPLSSSWRVSNASTLVSATRLALSGINSLPSGLPTHVFFASLQLLHLTGWSLVAFPREYLCQVAQLLSPALLRVQSQRETRFAMCL